MNSGHLHRSEYMDVRTH